jgi:hypothetical protein
VTAVTDRTQRNGGNTGAQVWRCEDCDCFHLRAGETLLTFTPQEFASFTEEVAACYCVQMPASEDRETGSYNTRHLLTGGEDETGERVCLIGYVILDGQ